MLIILATHYTDKICHFYSNTCILIYTEKIPTGLLQPKPDIGTPNHWSQ